MPDQLSTAFAALADPTRRAMLSRLADGEATLNELAEPFPVSLQAMSKHLKVLEAAGLVSRRRDGQRRPCRLRMAGLDSSAAWIERHRQLQEERYDRLGEHLQQLQRPQQDNPKDNPQDPEQDRPQDHDKEQRS